MAVGQVIVGVRRAVVTAAVDCTISYVVVSVGVNVMFCVVSPNAGTIVVSLNANWPATFATPPVSVELANVSPFITLVAVGQVIVGVRRAVVAVAVNCVMLNVV